MAHKRFALFGLLALVLSLWSVSKLRSQTPANTQPQNQTETAQPGAARNSTTNPQTDQTTSAPDTANSTSTPANNSQPATSNTDVIDEQSRERKVSDPGETSSVRDDHSVPLAPDVHGRFPLSANITTPQDPNAYKLSTNSDLVLLDVSVKDTEGGFVSGMTKDQFKILDNNKEQGIRYFEAGDIPVSLGLVVDNSGSMRAKRAEVVTAALAFVRASNPNDQVFVVNFNDRVRLGLPANVPFTDNRSMLRDALLRNPTEGRTAMNDGLQKGLEQLKQGKFYKKALILISDGGDNASQLRNDDMYRLLQESQATVYTIGIYDEDDRDKNPGVLKKIASLTGGECFLPQRLSDLVGVCTRIAKDIRNRYSLGFIPDTATFDGKPHALKVLASAPDRGKLAVRVRNSYIPPSAASAPSTTTTAKAAKKGH